ncbi:uncharacterized protein [Amphiura filiformis]|uniref:uncharacterized protein isoform X1 n=1 Tax=Amphiura filiformis TaxID=82378 RepID=UPI003B220A4F
MASQKQPELFGRVKSLLTLKSDSVNRDGPSRAKIDTKKKGEKIASKPKKAKTKTIKEPSPSKSSEKSEKKKTTEMTEETPTEKNPQPNQEKTEKKKLPDPDPVMEEEELSPVERLEIKGVNSQTDLTSVPIAFRSSVALSNRSSAYLCFDQLEKQKKEAYDLAKLEMLTGGFLDTAALESNAALLALLLKQATNDGFFWTVVALVVVAVCLQVAIGVILAFRFRSTLDMEEGSTGQASKKGGCFERLDASCWCSPKVLLFFAAVLLMVLNVVNMFIIAFAGQVSDQEEQAVEAAAPEVQ